MTHTNASASDFAFARASARALSDYPGPVPRSLEEAYAIQDTLIDMWPDELAGWKVAKIAPAWAERLGVDRYIGPIFSGSIQRGQNAAFPAIVGGSAIFEAEVAIELAADVDPDRADWSIQPVRALIGVAHIVVEAAGSPLATLSALGPLASIAAFGNNNGLIVGAALPDLDAIFQEEVHCSVEIDGAAIATAPVWMMPDGPLTSLAFALNEAARRGRPLRRGQLVSTGALTGVHRVRIGQQCAADFAAYGRIDCVVTAQHPIPGHDEARDV